MQNVWMKAGELVAFSTGEYSNYGYAGAFVALQDVSDAEFRALEDEVKTRKIKHRCDDEHELFLAGAIKRGWLLGVPLREIHLGEYSELRVCDLRA